MKSIEITTAHNIVFKYELAGAVPRCLATFLDLIIIIVFMVIGGAIFSWNTVLFYLFTFIPILLYHLIFEIFWQGQSPGKRVLKLQVVTLNGTTPTINDYFLRWIFRLIDITFSLGSLALINVLSSEKNQRIGDLIAQTSVISVKNSHQVNLKTLESLNDRSDQIKYPKLRNFSDEDMLLLKQAIRRYNEFKTSENELILKKIGTKIFKELEIKDKKVSVQILNSLLNEYVILTR